MFLSLQCIVLYCIGSVHLYSASCIAHQSEAPPVQETQREESSLQRTKEAFGSPVNKEKCVKGGSSFQSVFEGWTSDYSAGLVVGSGVHNPLGQGINLISDLIFI